MLENSLAHFPTSQKQNSKILNQPPLKTLDSSGNSKQNIFDLYIFRKIDIGKNSEQKLFATWSFVIFFCEILKLKHGLKSVKTLDGKNP